MGTKDQMETPVADLRARIDGKNRFNRVLSGYNPEQVNSYISELKKLHDQETQESKSAYAALVLRYRELEDQNTQLRDSIKQKEMAQTQLLAQSAEQEKDLAQLRAELAEWQEKNDPETIAKLSEENSRLSAALEMRNCEYESQKKQIQELERNNMAAALRLAETEQRLFGYKQDHRSKLNALKSLELNSLSELQMRLDGCLSFLNGFSAKNGTEWENLIKD
jgi:chromosome segregation ATPase